jgi:hypothetical protein
MNKLPAREGWNWVKQGFALFRKQPLGLAALFFGYLLLTIGLGLVPIVGKPLSYVLMPMFTVAFMQGCANAEQGKRVHPGLLLTGFRSPAFGSLIRLGLVYLALAMIAVAASTLVDGGVWLQVVLRQIEPDSAEAKNSALGAAVLFTAFAQLTFFVLLAFTGPLVHWKRMGVGKAVFYSVVGIFGATKPFMVFALAWFGISAIIGQVVFLVFGRTALWQYMLVVVSLIYTIAAFCSFYAIYCRLFGAPETEAVPVTPVNDA